tara:strand:- start:714 stop:887 length:174 start_codon:yes stop_codon:yes gene_type:complete
MPVSVLTVNKELNSPKVDDFDHRVIWSEAYFLELEIPMRHATRVAVGHVGKQFLTLM